MNEGDIPIDRDGGIPPYRQLYTALRKRIETGQFPPGRRLPSELEIERASGVSRDTIRKATQLLRDEGLVETVPGMGIVVKAPEPGED
jgi:DNA-binding GntR family transcriptional regulator